ncbi:MAG: signal peptidase I [Endomicrobiia bacterium]
MSDKKYIDIAKKLIEESNTLTYTVISKSMYPLINKNDKITCSKVEHKNIKKYSLVAFYTNSDTSQVPTVHRVINILQKNNELSFRTKGDNNLSFDRDIVHPKQIIGIVDHIIKKNFIISLDKNVYKFINIFIYLLSNLKNLIKCNFVQIKNIIRVAFIKEKKIQYDDNLIVLRQSILTKDKDWLEIIQTNISLLMPLLNKNMKICDISFGGGYCEESFCFIRKSFKIDYKNIKDFNNEDKYDFIICSRVINIVETKEKRQEIYNLLKLYIKSDGKILFSYINEKNNLFVSMKRSIFKLLFKNYDGPCNNDIIYKDVFIMKILQEKYVSAELENNGFYIIKQFCSDKIKTFLLESK